MVTEIKPYAITELRSSSSECDYCGEGEEIDYPHAHALYVQREGASHRTADELAELFLLETAELVPAYVVPEWVTALELEGWADNPDDSQGLSDEIMPAESALSDAGFYSYWDDGFNIGRIVEPCGVCEELCYEEREEHWCRWLSIADDDALSYVPRLHDHAPARELEESAEEGTK